jgi:hypothetical protein
MPKALRTLGNLGTDAAEADHAEGFLEEFDTRIRLPIPLTRLHGRGSLGHRTGATEDMREGQFGRRDRVARRGIHHDHPPLGGGFDIDVIHADAGATYDFQKRSRRKDRGRDLRFRANRDRMDVFDELKNLLGRRAVGLNDFDARLLAQVGDSFG